MRQFNVILANLICQGEVTVDIPEVDINELERLADSEAQQILRKIAETVGRDELTDSEKIMMLRAHLE